MIIITGTYPPERCGVGDYTCNLLQTQAAKDWHLLYFRDWSLKTFFKKIKEIDAYSDEWINMQYPSIGYGKSIVPQLLCIYYATSRKKKFSLTIHEYTQCSAKRKAMLSLFFLFAAKYIFTNQFERNAAAQFFPRIFKRSQVIKIQSNIKRSSNIGNIFGRKYDIGYFGYIRPEKGIEEFFKVVTQIKTMRSKLNIYIMGQILSADHCNYTEKLINNLTATNIECILNKSQEEVADVLAQTKIAFLPFPDGISERRGSFLAAAKNDCIVVTTNGKFITQALAECCETVEIENAKETIFQILDDEKIMTEKQNKIRSYMENEIPQSWNEIAEQYNNFLK